MLMAAIDYLTIVKFAMCSNIRITITNSKVDLTFHSSVGKYKIFYLNKIP